MLAPPEVRRLQSRRPARPPRLRAQPRLVEPTLPDVLLFIVTIIISSNSSSNTSTVVMIVIVVILIASLRQSTDAPGLRPISPLRISPLRLLDSNFPGNSLRAWEFHPLKLILCLSQTL